MTKGQFEESLESALMKSSLSRIKTFCRQEDFHLNKSPDVSKDHAQKPNLVLILISGQDVHITLKVFFDAKKCPSLTEQTHGQSDQEDEQSHRSVDVVKELSNLIAGHIKMLLDQAGINCEISLPISMRGYDEIFFKDDINLGLKKNQWEIYRESEKLTFVSVVRNSLDNDIELEYVEESSTIELF